MRAARAHTVMVTDGKTQRRVAGGVAVVDSGRLRRRVMVEEEESLCALTRPTDHNKEDEYQIETMPKREAKERNTLQHVREKQQ